MKMKCSRCGRKAAVELKYFDGILCNRCFSSLFEKRVKKYIRVNKLLEKKDTVVLGLSGNRDSTVLLHIFKKIFFKAPKSKLIAVTMDNGSSTRTVDFTRKLCEKLDVEYHTCKKGKTSIWTALGSRAKALKADKIALGINLDDEVEYTLERIFKGELRGVYSKEKIGVIKPLRESPKKEVELYAKANRIKYIKEGRKEEDEFKDSVKKMLADLERKQPGSKFKLLKSGDKFMEALKNMKS